MSDRTQNPTPAVAGMTRAHVEEAAGRLRGLVVRTPALRCPALDALAGAELAT
jgi:hypothetical protein